MCAEHTFPKVPPMILLGLRDMLSVGLGVSVSFVDRNGDPIGIERFHVKRRFTSEVCNMYHFVKGSNVKVQICDKWDKEASEAIRRGESKFVKPCGLGFNCVAVPLKIQSSVVGCIFAGERYITTQDKDCEKGIKLGAEILGLKGNEYNKYKYEWGKTLANQSRLTEEEWKRITDEVELFGRFVSMYFENLLKNLPLGSIQPVELSKLSAPLRETIHNTLKHFETEEISTLFDILGSGFPVTNQWLWEFNDPNILDPGSSAQRQVNAYVLFADIRNFTEACNKEGFPAVDAARRSLFEKVLDNVKSKGGIVDKFIGDAVLVYFFIPHENEIHAVEVQPIIHTIAKDVAECALALQSLSEYAGRIKLQFGIGITYGDVRFGHFCYAGKEGYRRENTAIGPPVNKAQRLSALARKLSYFGIMPAVIVDDDFKKLLPTNGRFECKKIDDVRLKGFKENYETVYTLLNREAPATELEKRKLNLSQGFLSIPPTYVADAIADYYEAMKHSREKQLPLGDPQEKLPGTVATFLGCPANNLTFRSNTTECIESALDVILIHLMNHKKSFSKKKKVALVTDLEHPTVQEAIRLRFDKVCYVRLKEGIQDISEKFKQELNSLSINNCVPLVILFPHITWESGFCIDYRKLSRVILDWSKNTVTETKVIVDGAHSLGHVPVKLEIQENVLPPFHFYVTCVHKWLRGPHGVGILYVSSEILSCPECKSYLAFKDIFTRTGGLGAEFRGLQSRTHDRAKAYASLAAFEYYRRQNKDWLPQKIGEESLKKAQKHRYRLLEELKKFGVEAVSPEPKSSETITGILAVRFPDMDVDNHEKLCKQLETSGITVDLLHGEDFGIRFCITHDLSEDDLEYVSSSVKDILSNWKK